MSNRTTVLVANAKSFAGQTKKRREARRNTILQEHKKQVHHIEEDIRTTFKAHYNGVYGSLSITSMS